MPVDFLPPEVTETVVGCCVEELHAARVATFFFQLFGAADDQTGLSRCLLARLPGGDELLDLTLVVEAKLVVHLGLDFFALESRPRLPKIRHLRLPVR